MGGFVEADESVEAAAQRVLHDLTGLHDVYMEQVGAFGAVDRDPGERVVSVAYYALINFDDLDREAMEKLDARWIGINELPPALFRPSRNDCQSPQSHSTEVLNRACRFQAASQAVHDVADAEPV